MSPETFEPGRMQRGQSSMTDLARLMRRRWYVFLPVFAIWALAYVRLFVDATPRVPLLFNWTPSLPYTVAILHSGPVQLRRGDYVVFAFHGAGASLYPGLANQPFFKIVRGVPGDTVVVRGREVWLNGELVGVAKTHAFDHQPLRTIHPGVIPDGSYYVQGLSADSFDSRYLESGLIRREQVIGLVDPLL